MSESSISISVVYALPERQWIVRLSVPLGTTVAQAVALSNLPEMVPQLADESPQCAIFSRVVKGSETLKDGDRIELLRPLLIDPKDNRRLAAARGRGVKR